MKDLLEYKDFIGSIHFSAEDRVLHGKIEGIDDLIMFEGTTVEEIENSFIEAVEDYIDICEKHEKKLYRSYKGSFNIRITPELHKKAVIKSRMEGMSLNQFVKQAIEHEVSG